MKRIAVMLAALLLALAALPGAAADELRYVSLRVLVIPAGPELIKPNAQEFRALTGADPADRAAAEAACQTLIRQGVQRVCLSLGAGGARLYSREGVCSCPAAPVKPLGLQGAGDALLAGLLAAMERGCADGDALRFASAAAGAAVMRPGTLSCRMEDVTVLLAQPW